MGRFSAFYVQNPENLGHFGPWLQISASAETQTCTVQLSVLRVKAN